MADLIFIGVLAFIASVFIYRPFYGLVAFAAALIFFREGWHPSLAQAWTLYNLDIARIHLTELVVIFFIAVLGIRHLLDRSKPFVLPPYTGALQFFLFLMPLGAAYGFYRGASLSNAFGYGEWRAIFFALLMTIIVPAILTSPAKVRSFFHWIFWLAFFRALQGVVLYWMGQGQIHATLGRSVVFWDSAENLLFAVLVVYAAAGVLLRKPVFISHWVRLAAALPMLFSIVFSLRRNAWLQLIISAFVVFLMFKTSQKIKVMAGIGGVMVGVGLFSLAGWGGDSVQMVGSRLASFASTKTDTNSFHLYDLYDAVQTIKTKPVFGVGFGMGFQRNKTDKVGGRGIEPNVVHNCYLHIWLKMGIAGLMAFMAFWGAVFIYGVRGVRLISDPDNRLLVQVLLISFFALLNVIMWGTDLVANTRVPFLFYTLVGVMAAMVIQYRPRDENRQVAYK